jgi:hypothetical protein
MILAGVIIFLLIIVLLIMLILKKKNPANNAPAIELTMPQAPSGDQIQQ